jgi:hypothetical protein
MAYLKNPSHQSVSICLFHLFARQRLGENPLIVARQRLGENVTAAINTHATIEELLYMSLRVRSVS